MNPRIRTRVIICLCVLGVVLALWGVNYPFVGIYNTNNNYLSLAAKNYLRFGFSELKFLPTYFAGGQFTPSTPYYLHHPIVVFWLEAASLFIFGVHNWAVHVPQFLFVIGTLVAIYIIAKILWNQKVALWSLGLSAIFPMTTFFWKYMQFEQASLLFSLITYSLIIRYLNKPSPRTLMWIFFTAFVSGCIDWGVLYLLGPLCIFFFTKHKKVVIPVFAVYAAGAALSLGLFVGAVYLLQNGFLELGTAIWGRSYTAELTSLSFWPVRLMSISVLRAVLYFTPVALPAFWLFYRQIRARRTLSELTLLFFFVYGLLNLIFLPAASWGHSYFLYYFIPFFAFSGGLFLTRTEKHKRLLWFWLTVILVSSIAINYLKIQQVKKQLWKYDVALHVSKTLLPHETVGVVEFPGDVFENYFLHPSQPMTPAEFISWQKGMLYPEVRYTVITSGDNANLVTKETSITPYIPKPDTLINENGIIRLYRIIRDILSVGQI